MCNAQKANLTLVERIIAGTDGDVVGTLVSKLGDWGEKRAEVMARHEAAMALNKTLVAGYRQAGYSSVWRAAPGSCKMCLLLNDQPITTLTPPLHRGCACTVDRGAKAQPLSDEQKYGNMKAYLESAGMYGLLNYPPKRIAGVEKFRFDSEHSNRKHDATEADARSFVRNASFSLSRRNADTGKWSECYFSSAGCSFVIPEDNVIRTAFRDVDFDPRTRAVIGEAMRIGL